MAGWIFCSEAQSAGEKGVSFEMTEVGSLASILLTIRSWL